MTRPWAIGLVATLMIVACAGEDPGGDSAEAGSGSGDTDAGSGGSESADGNDGGGEASDETSADSGAATEGGDGGTGDTGGGSTGGGSTGGGLPDCSFDPSVKFDIGGEELQLETADGSFCVRIERRDEGPGIDANTAYTILDVRIGPLGPVTHVDDPDDMCWRSTHHNYKDFAHVWTGATHYDVVLRTSGEHVVYELDTGPLGASCLEQQEDLDPPPTPLVPVNP